MGYRVRGGMIHVFGTVEGEYYRLSTGIKAEKINLKWIEKNHQKVLSQLVDEKKNKSNVTNFVEYGKDSLRVNAVSRKKNTTKGFFYLFDKHIEPYFRYYNIIDIKAMDIKKWQMGLLQKNLSGNSIRNCRTVLNSILEDARMNEVIKVNPLSLVKLPKTEKTGEVIVPFTLEEIQLILSNANEWLNGYLRLAFFTGMRTGELLALKWEDIDFTSKRIFIRRSMTKGIVSTPKNGKERIIDMLPIVEECLKELFRKNGLAYEWIFTHKYKKPYAEPGSITKNMWKPALKKSGLAYRKLYNTRHTFATIMLLGGEDILWVSKMLGHSDISTTMKYYIKYVQTNQQKRATFLTTFDTKLTQSNLGSVANNDKAGGFKI